MNEIKKEDEKHLEHLSRIRVVSDETKQWPTDELKKQKHKLPTITRARPEPEYGVATPKTVPPGKITLELYIKILDERHYTPDVWTNKHIAEQFNIEEEHVDMITDHFKPYKVFKYEKEHVPWHSPRKMEELILGIVTPSTWRAHYEQKQREIEAGEKYEQQQLEDLERGRKQRFLAWQKQQKLLAEKQKELQLEAGSKEPEASKVKDDKGDDKSKGDDEVRSDKVDSKVTSSKQ